MGFGFILSIICLIVSFKLLGNNEGSGYAGARVGGIGILFTLFYFFIVEFWSALLMVSSLLFIALYFIVANKTSLQTVIYSIWNSKLSGYVKPKIESYLKMFSENQPNWLKEVSSPVKLKLKLLDTVKRDTKTPAIQKKVIRYGLKKVKLDDVDFQQENISLSEILGSKINGQISAVAKPSYRLFFIMTGLQFILLIMALYFDGR